MTPQRPGNAAGKTRPPLMHAGDSGFTMRSRTEGDSHETAKYDYVSFRAGLGEEDLRKLTKRFAEVGQPPGVIAHYVRLDGAGGFMLQEPQEDPEAVYENALRYQPWIEIEIAPVATIEEGFPVALRVYG
jgi:hypothetical protein